MIYRELFYKATRLINKGDITLGEYEEITKPLDREIEQKSILNKIRAEIEQLRLHKAEFITSDNKVCIDSQEVLNIIDKYKAESEE